MAPVPAGPPGSNGPDAALPSESDRVLLPGPAVLQVCLCPRQSLKRGSYFTHQAVRQQKRFLNVSWFGSGSGSTEPPAAASIRDFRLTMKETFSHNLFPFLSTKLY